MKRLTAALTLSVALFAAFATGGVAWSREQSGAPASKAGGEWLRYTYPGEEFSVALPSAPTVFHTKRDIIGTIQDEDARIFGAYADGVAYVVISYDRPRAHETLDALVKNFFTWRIPRGRAWEAGELKLGRAEGRAYRHVIEEKEETGARDAYEVEGSVRIYRTGSHAYLVEAFGAVASDPRVRKFLGSFALSPKPEGKLISEMERISVPDKPPPEARASASPAPAPTPQPTPGGEAVNGAYLRKYVTRRAVILTKPEPGFTEAARRGSVTGVVRLKMVLGSDGKPRDVTVVKFLPAGLTERAVNAARAITFIPATKDGRRVSQWITIEYTFNIY